MFRSPGTPGRRQQIPRTWVNLHAGLAGLIQGGDGVGIAQGVELRTDVELAVPGSRLSELINSMIVDFSVNGACSGRFMGRTPQRLVSCWKTLWTSPISGFDVR